MTVEKIGVALSRPSSSTMQSAAGVDVGRSMPANLCSLSIVVPVHNEAEILDDNVRRMLRGLRKLSRTFEIVVCENGSIDDTAERANALASEYPEVRLERLQRADYGRALNHAIDRSAGEVVVIFNIDFWSVEFVDEAVRHLDEYDLVVGSKRMAGSRDRRPLVRRVITWGFNSFLRWRFGFRGTDTHGLKAFRKEPLAKIARECVTEQWIFDTELVLRAGHEGLRIVEVPVSVAEMRPPSYWSIVRRMPRTLHNIRRLAKALRQLDR